MSEDMGKIRRFVESDRSLLIAVSTAIGGINDPSCNTSPTDTVQCFHRKGSPTISCFDDIGLRGVLRALLLGWMGVYYGDESYDPSNLPYTREKL